MRQVNSLNHTRWECKYHIVFIPKYRNKVLFGQIRQEIGETLHRLARQKESEIEEGQLMPDHVHMMISIPPKYAVSQVIGYIKMLNRMTVTTVTPPGFCLGGPSVAVSPASKGHWCKVLQHPSSVEIIE